MNLEEWLVSLRFSLHQQILGISGEQVCLRLGFLLYQTPRVCFMITMRYCLLCKYHILHLAYYLLDHHLPRAILMPFFHLALLQYLSQSEYLKGINMYVSILKAYTSYASPKWDCFKRWLIRVCVPYGSLFPQRTWCYIINKNKTHHITTWILC